MDVQLHAKNVLCSFLLHLILSLVFHAAYNGNRFFFYKLCVTSQHDELFVETMLSRAKNMKFAFRRVVLNYTMLSLPGFLGVI